MRCLSRWPLFAGAVMLWPLVSGAEEGLAHPADGHWTLQTPEAQLRSTLNRAVEEVAGEFPMLIRELARQKLHHATRVCTAYRIDVEQGGVHFSCDGAESVWIPTDGPPLQSTNRDGEPISGRATLSEDGVVVTWTSATGTRTNTFSRAVDGLSLEVTVTAAKLPRPLRWGVRYQSAPARPPR